MAKSGATDPNVGVQVSTTTPAPVPVGGVAAAAKKMKKTVCPVSRKQFRERATSAIVIRIGDIPAQANKREFSTGSFGWNINEKTTLTIDGVPCKCQVNLCITVVGSKDAEEE